MNIETDRIELERPRKANECFVDEKHYRPPEKLFAEFWREGELALFFGPSGAGKSVLAMQLADCLARGRSPLGFWMRRVRRKILYVDNGLSDRQFQERYSYFSAGSYERKSYKFAENLYHHRPPAGADLCDWVAAMVREHGFQAVIIDDLSAVKRTHDGIRETLDLMRRLRRVKDELDVSILVVAASDGPLGDRDVSERDLGRSRVLCGVADSVFALGPGSGPGDEQCLIQMRSRNAPIFWTEENAPTGKVERLEDGLLGFQFDERFAPDIDEETRELICRIHGMRENGTTFAAIAAELGLSKTRCFKLNRKWVPAMDERDHEDENHEDDDDENYDADRWDIGDEPDGRLPELPAQPDIMPSDEPETPRLHGPARVSVYDMKRGVDGYGDEIFIQAEEAGKPKIWYKFDRRGRKEKRVRQGFGITGYHLGPTEYL